MSEIVSWPQVDGRGLAPQPGFPVLPQVGRVGRAATLQPHWSACTRSGRGRAGEEPASDTWPRPWPGHAPPSRSARGVKPAENTWLLTSPRMRAKAENSPNALDLTLRFGKDNRQWESKKKKKSYFYGEGDGGAATPGARSLRSSSSLHSPAKPVATPAVASRLPLCARPCTLPGARLKQPRGPKCTSPSAPRNEGAAPNPEAQVNRSALFTTATATTTGHSAGLQCGDHASAPGHLGDPLTASPSLLLRG